MNQWHREFTWPPYTQTHKFITCLATGNELQHQSMFHKIFGAIKCAQYAVCIIHRQAGIAKVIELARSAYIVACVKVAWLGQIIMIIIWLDQTYLFFYRELYGERLVHWFDVFGTMKTRKCLNLLFFALRNGAQ